MPVAPIYKEYHIFGEPYKKEDNKYYVDINFKGFPKTVRWYTNSEYALLKHLQEWKSASQIYEKYGFNPLTKTTLVVLGETYSIKYKLKTSGAKFSTGLLSHFPYSEENKNTMLSLNRSYKVVSWNEITNNGLILTEEEIKSKIFPKE